MKAILTDDVANTVGIAHFSTLPRAGDTVYLHMFAGGRSGGKAPPLQIGRFRVECVEYEAYNTVMVEGWQRPYLDGPDAQASLIVSALDDPTRAYLQRVKVKNR